MERLLVVEDKASLRDLLREALSSRGFAVECLGDGTEAVARLEREAFDAVITDFKLPGADGMAVLEAALERDPEVPVLMVTAFGTVELAVEAMRRGAADFLLKPVDPDHLLLLVERALGRRRLQRENLLLKSEAERRGGFPAIVGQSPLMQAVSEQVRKVAPTDATVLLAGESGTGKELFARAIHQLSRRAAGPFVAVNCAAIPETLIENELFGHEKGSYTGAHARQAGKFELAGGGTIFLDEIGELGRDVQGKILRVLQERTLERLGGTVTLRVDVRIIAASNQDLRKAVEAGRFREDLFFRLNIFPITVPPLRHRMADIPLLAEFFLRKFEGELGKKGLALAPEALAKLQAYGWPGNVRELENALERAAILARGRLIGPGEIVLFADREAQPGVGDLLDLGGTLAEATARAVRAVERWKIGEALRATGGDRRATAERLGVSLKALNMKIKDLDGEESSR